MGYMVDQCLASIHVPKVIFQGHHVQPRSNGSVSSARPVGLRLSKDDELRVNNCGQQHHRNFTLPTSR